MTTDRAALIARLLGLDDAKLQGFAHHAREVALAYDQRKDALRLLRRLSKLKGGFDLSALSRIAVIFYPRNRRIVSEIVRDAVERSNRQKTLLDEIVPAMLEALKSRPPIRSLASIVAALSASSLIAARMGASIELICRLSEYYDATAQASPDRETLLARLDLLEGVQRCLRAAYMSPAASPDATSAGISAMVLALLALPSRSGANTPHSLVNLSLLADLEAICHLSAELGELHPAVVADERVENVRERLASLVPTGQVQSGLDLLIFVDKGKGRAVESAQTSGPSDAAVQEILDVLPDSDPAFIRRCLAHPEFANASSTKLISALLEDKLPLELKAPALDPHASTFVPAAAPKPSTKLSARANIFDAQPMDESKIRWFKGDKPAVDDDAERKAFLAATKAAIIARAEAPSSDEEEEEETDDDAALRKLVKAEVKKSRGGMRDATLEELDDDEGVLLPASVPRATESDESDEEDKPAQPARPQPNPAGPSGFSAAQQTALEKAYVADPSIFDKTSTARSSAARKALQAETGLASDLIESWRVMLDRDPRKDKILAKHSFARAFTGNARGPIEDNSEQSSDGGSGQRGGHRGRGRGTGKRGAHDRRRRGHDRKMARGM